MSECGYVVVVLLQSTPKTRACAQGTPAARPGPTGEEKVVGTAKRSRQQGGSKVCQGHCESFRHKNIPNNINFLVHTHLRGRRGISSGFFLTALRPLRLAWVGLALATVGLTSSTGAADVSSVSSSLTAGAAASVFSSMVCVCVCVCDCGMLEGIM